MEKIKSFTVVNFLIIFLVSFFRLSDFLFTVARLVSQREGKEEKVYRRTGR